jgi:hypothetical protein
LVGGSPVKTGWNPPGVHREWMGFGGAGRKFFMTEPFPESMCVEPSIPSLTRPFHLSICTAGFAAFLGSVIIFFLFIYLIFRCPLF